MNIAVNSNGSTRSWLLETLLCVAASFLFASPASSQSSLPEGAEKETVEAVCTVCHTTERILAAGDTRQDWAQRIRRMISNGAELPENKIDAVADYLAKSFPPLEGAAGPAPRTPDGKPDLSGTWVKQKSGFTFVHLDLDMTDWGKERYLWNTEPVIGEGYVEKAERARIELDPVFNCYPPGLVRLGPPTDTVGGGSGAIEITQTPGMTIVVYDARNAVRYVYTDGREHPKPLDLTWNGHSIGKWEGDTLVVDTVGLREETWLSSDGQEHSADLHVVERFRRVDMGDLEIERTLTDPKALAKPFTSRIALRLNPRYSLPISGNNDCTQYMVRKPAFGKGIGGLLGISDHPKGSTSAGQGGNSAKVAPKKE